MTDSEPLVLLHSAPVKGQHALYDKYFHYIYAIIFRMIRGDSLISYVKFDTAATAENGAIIDLNLGDE